MVKSFYIVAVNRISHTTHICKYHFGYKKSGVNYAAKLKAVYNTGEEDLAATAYVLSGFDSATPGEKTITVTYEGKTATFKVNVIAVVAESIAIASEPTKKEYC